MAEAVTAYAAECLSGLVARQRTLLSWRVRQARHIGSGGQTREQGTSVL